MRLLELHQTLLLEHNVVNADAISRYVTQFASLCHSPNAAAWFTTTLARALEKDDQINVKMTDDMIPRNAPDWLDAAVERGDDLRIFHPPTHMTSSYEHLVDYFNWLAEQKDPVLENRDRLLKVNVDTALKKADDWTAQAARKASGVAVEGMKEIFADGAFRWMEPETLQALKRDGAILHQCTANGTYDDQFKNGTMKFYILHDPKGQPHVCVSINARSKVLDQVKGKQNQPPVGRYARLCASFLDHMQFAEVAQNRDVRQMGLVLNKDGKLVTVVEATGRVVFKIGNVRVYEVEGSRISIGNSYDGHKEHTGIDYWFNSQEGDLFKIKISNNSAYLNSFDNRLNPAKVRSLCQEFLNNYFEGGAPPPLRASNTSAAKNLLWDRDELNLDYNALTKKYGSIEEVGELAFESDGYKGYRWGRDGQYGSTHVAIRVVDQEGTLTANIELNREGDKVGNISTTEFSENDLEYKAMKPTFTNWLNKLGKPPSEDIRQQSQKWREKIGIYYDQEKGWGDFTSVCKKLWEKAPYTCYQRNEIGDPITMLMKKGQIPPVFEIRSFPRYEVSELHGDITKTTYDTRGDAEYESDNTNIPKLLMALLNNVKEIDSSKFNDGQLDKFNVFLANGQTKWQTRDKAGEMFHKFDDNAYFTVIKRGSENVYNLYDGSDKPVLAISIDGRELGSNMDFSESKLRGSREVQWLLNSLHVEGIDTIDAGQWRDDEKTNALLWRLGLFHDTRTESWKLIQDGKLVHDGDGYRAVGFRNRVFIIDTHDGVTGWFKKDGNMVGDKRVVGNNSKEFYSHLEDLLHNSVFSMSRNHHEDKDLRKKGFYWGKGDGEDTAHRFRSAAKSWPEKVVLKMPKGYEWVRMSVDPVFHGREEEKTPHGDSYSLRGPDGKTFMRANFDGDHLEQAIFSTKDTFDGYNVTDSLKQMKEGAQKKFFLALLEKLKKKLLPTQARDIGYFRTRNGTYKSLKGNKSLEGFLDGKIDFGDGHEFRYEKYDNAWTLGIENPDTESYHDKFKPYLKVKLDDDGIESVHYIKKEIKRSPKEYMPYIHKLMQIFATVSGE